MAYKGCYTTAGVSCLMRRSTSCSPASHTGQQRICVVLFPSHLTFVSLLQYAPRGTTPLSQVSRTVTYKVQSDGFIGSTRVVDHAARRMAEHLGTSPCLQECFGPDVSLVPMPRSSPRRAGFLWPAERICVCLLAEGLGREIPRFWNAPNRSNPRHVRPRASAPIRQTIMSQPEYVLHNHVSIPPRSRSSTM